MKNNILQASLDAGPFVAKRSPSERARRLAPSIEAAAATMPVGARQRCQPDQLRQLIVSCNTVEIDTQTR